LRKEKQWRRECKKKKGESECKKTLREEKKGKRQGKMLPRVLLDRVQELEKISLIWVKTDVWSYGGESFFFSMDIQSEVGL